MLDLFRGKNYPDAVGRNVVALLLGLLSGCSFTWPYQEGPSSADECRFIVTRTDPSAVIERVAIDRSNVGVSANTLDIPAGEHRVALRYRIDAKELCDSTSSLCAPTTLRGECTGTVRTMPGRSYLLSLDTRFGEVSAQVAPKGLFDIFSRQDEPNIGGLACNTPARVDDFRRVL